MLYALHVLCPEINLEGTTNELFRDKKNRNPIFLVSKEFNIIFALDFLDCKKAEKTIHNKLEKFHVSGEFFAALPNELVTEIVKYKEYEKKQCEKYMNYEKVMEDISLLETEIYYKFRKK